jgi:PAS domain S-box-containing protein
MQAVFKKETGEINLNEEHEFLRALLEHASDGIYFKDRQSRFLLCSQFTYTRHGGKEEDVIGKTDFDFFDKNYAQSTFDDEQAIIRTGQPIVNKIEHEISKNGDKAWCIVSKWPLRNQAGEIIGTCGISKDITGLKNAEAKLEQVNKQLMVASRMAGMAEVATTVLHNVGNVLNSINISSSVISDMLRNSKVGNLGKAAALIEKHNGDLPDFLTNDPKGKQLPSYLSGVAAHMAADEKKLREEFAALYTNIEHIKEIISRQQSYAKLSGVLEMVSPRDLIEDAMQLNAGAFERHQVEVIREICPVPPLLIDKHQALQILVNLLRNAKHAVDDHGHADKRVIIRITRGESGTVKFSVIDNGVGIHPDNMEKIFAHGFTTRKNGHGFGLHSGALAAKQLGGTLTCQSDGPGKGATFTLELPLPAPGSN